MLSEFSFFFPLFLGAVEIKCPQCEETVSSIECYIEHQQIKHFPDTECAKRKYACNLCSYSSFVKDHLRKHLMRHYDIKPFTCQNCKCSFTTKPQLTRHHINNHLNLKWRRRWTLILRVTSHFWYLSGTLLYDTFLVTNHFPDAFINHEI